MKESEIPPPLFFDIEGDLEHTPYLIESDL